MQKPQRFLNGTSAHLISPIVTKVCLHTLHDITLETIYSGLSKITSRNTMATQLKNNVWV